MVESSDELDAAIEDFLDDSEDSDELESSWLHLLRSQTGFRIAVKHCGRLL